MNKQNSLGVVIGRFQIHELHEGHVALLDYVDERHEEFLILIGHNTIRFNTADPFPFHIRKQMLASRYPGAHILPLPDSQISPTHWSEVVDQKVAGVSSTGEAVLYGSRDSFIPFYSGQFPTKEVSPFKARSGTEVRQEASGQYLDDPKFRLGWLSAIHSQYVVTDPTVDMAVHMPDFSRVLLGRRGKGSPLRFFGGFVDKDDQSYEAGAKRERSEEVLGIETSEPVYLGSTRIADKRYQRSEYGIMTTFFAMEYQGGNPAAGDDIGLVEWCGLNESLIEEIVPSHLVLLEILLQYKEKVLAA